MLYEGNLCSAHVLVVDDDPDTLSMLSQALVRYGYEVSIARSCEAAMELVREWSFDLVLCDLSPEDRSPLDFTRTLSQIHPTMPIVLITDHGDPRAARESLYSGASDFVTKPLELGRLPIILENNIQRKKIEAQKLSENRSEVLFQTIKALAGAIDAKSEYTGCHSARMAELCLAIGQEIELDQHNLNTLELAAHIHDVGKIATPDSILAKPGKLTEDEWGDILKHPSLGADFLAGIDELAEVAAVIRHHHEHVDGTGYPDGLKGDAIPVLARILAVADAFEAMTSDRPYRKALDPVSAVRELKQNAGSQFDPDVVAAATKVIVKMMPPREPIVPGTTFPERPT